MTFFFTIDSAGPLLQAKMNDLFMVADYFRLTAGKIEELRRNLKFNEYMNQVTELWLSLRFPVDEAMFKQTRIRRNAWLVKWYEIRCQCQKKISTEPTFISEC